MVSVHLEGPKPLADGPEGGPVVDADATERE